MYKRGKATPVIGASHGSDLAEFYGVGTKPDFIGTDALSEWLSRPSPLGLATHK